MAGTTPETDTIALALRMARARRLAEEGRWREAEAELSPGGGLPSETKALHALAVVVTQSGDNARALYLWKQFLQREPMHDEATRMVEAIALWQSRPSWYRYLPAGAAGAAVLILLPLLYWAFSPGAAPAPAASPLRPAPASYAASPSPNAPRPASVQPSRPASAQPARPAQPAQDDSGPSISFPKPRKK